VSTHIHPGSFLPDHVTPYLGDQSVCVSFTSLSSLSSLTYPQCSFDRGDVSFIILAGALVFLMIPGLGASRPLYPVSLIALTATPMLQKHSCIPDLHDENPLSLSSGPSRLPTPSLSSSGISGVRHSWRYLPRILMSPRQATRWPSHRQQAVASSVTSHASACKMPSMTLRRGPL
jgi:hypothetical protein